MIKINQECHNLQEIPALENLSLLPSFEDFINNEKFHTDAILEDSGEVTCKKIIGKIYEEARLLNDRFTDLSSYMDDHIKFTLKALQAAKDECISILHHSESLNLNIEKLEARSQAQEFEISSLQTEAMRLLSACSHATQELRVKMSDLSCFDSEPEDVNVGLDIKSPASVSQFALAADNLLLTYRKVISQSQNLLKINKDMSISLENLKHELNYTEITAETAINERKLFQERVLKLEGDIDALQNSCNEMNAKRNDYQSKEYLIKGNQAELCLFLLEVLFDFAVFNDLPFFLFQGLEMK